MTNQTSYQTAYNTLKTNANLLQNSEHIDIDKLMDIVSESINAYQICQERILAMEQALNKVFDETQSNNF